MTERNADAGFDAALDRWLERQAAAEERLTSFAFREGQADIAVPAPTSHAEIRSWIVAVAGASDVAEFLRALAPGERPMSELAAEGAFGLRSGDRVAVAARVGMLTAAGLVARELETDRVGLTELGRAVLERR